jgi:ribose/xylose/arabinose/galactoside ABC-type transport system permease subunit
VALILGVVFLNSSSPLFPQRSEHLAHLVGLHGNGLMMLAMVFVIVTGNIDLSVASNLA